MHLSKNPFPVNARLNQIILKKCCIQNFAMILQKILMRRNINLEERKKERTERIYLCDIFESMDRFHGVKEIKIGRRKC